MLADFMKGAGYVLVGCRLLGRPGVGRFVIIPLFISALVFTGGIWYTGHLLGSLIETIIPQWLDWLRYLLWPLFALAAMVVLYFGFVLVANIVGAPFNSWLAEAVERTLTGNVDSAPTSWRQLPGEAGVIIVSELRKMGYFALWAIPFVLLLWVPVAGALLWFLFSAWVMVCNYADYPMGNHGLKFVEQRRLLRSRRALSLGFGVAALLVTLVPLLNFLAMPAAVAGATAMYQERLRAHSGIGEGLLRT
ncbi:MAG: sulfate transporter CysZ [Chromatiales bacterium]